MLRAIVKKLLGERICSWLRVRWGVSRRIADECIRYDKRRQIQFSGALGPRSRERLRARLIMHYHVLEKGLTMPNRRYGFGVEMLKDLISLVEDFEHQYGRDDQVDHAVGVIRAYFELHNSPSARQSVSEPGYWELISSFLNKHEDVSAAHQPHVRREEFYSKRRSPFPEFAWSRHTLRHYSNKELPVTRIKQAVDLARSTPTACNRQHCHVYCVSSKGQMEKLLAIQGGSRGFGHLANKLLVVTADLQDLTLARERNDAFVNGGMFLMNLCYSLHYYEIAHCVLNWSKMPQEDMAMRKLVAIRPSETVVAILPCGEAPDEFDVAMSPRKKIDEVFVEL